MLWYDFRKNNFQSKNKPVPTFFETGDTAFEANHHKRFTELRNSSVLETYVNDA